MAKSKKTKPDDVQTPEVEVVVDALIEAGDDTVALDTDVAQAVDADVVPADDDSAQIEQSIEDEITSASEESDAVVEDIIEPEITETPAPVAPPASKGGMGGALIGGVVAAALGFGAAQYSTNSWPFGDGGSEAAQLDASLKAAKSEIATLRDDIAGRATLDDLSALQAALAEQTDGINAKLADLDGRLVVLEKAPMGEGASNAAMNAYESEMSAMRDALAVQRSEIEGLISAASAQKQSAENVASQTLARAAVTRILVALESGAPFDAALADLQSTSTVEVSEIVAKTAATGTPTLADLSASFPDVARDALSAARASDTGGGMTGFLRSQLGTRSVAPREGDDPDAILSRMEAAVREGRLSDALAEMQDLPDTAKAPLSGWSEQAQLRLSVLADVETLANSVNSQ